MIQFKHDPIKLGLDLLSKKWTYAIIELLRDKRMRYSDIQQQLPEISSKILASRLKELFELGLIGKIISNMIPLHFKYHITDLGRQTRKVYYELAILGCKIFRDEIFGDDNYSSEAISSYFKVKFNLD